MGTVTDQRDTGTESTTDGVDAVYGVIVGVLYVLAVGVQVYLVVDEVTDGALSADVKARWSRLRARWTQARRIDAEMREAAPWVLWEAYQALEADA